MKMQLASRIDTSELRQQSRPHAQVWIANLKYKVCPRRTDDTDHEARPHNKIYMKKIPASSVVRPALRSRFVLQ